MNGRSSLGTDHGGSGVPRRRQSEEFWCREAGCSMGETPILFENRRSGSSKINKSEAIKALQIIFQLGVDRMLGRTRSGIRDVPATAEEPAKSA